ncbi:hypothetical protein JCM19241_4828 [Vibrio ishigakensis]|uniref:Outer membrane protein beta-barrel domain-containing protein n=1 Tax=Vibrio ishigakensis TaxID=1481914 RepID=A0A0B8QSX9_9VIBR|nr:hypothetical protein JCM19241_4828 [Vibrio ishigakensis]
MGYDFNRIVGINLSYQESDYSETTYFETLKVDGTTVKVDADVGFAFDFQGWSLKPYGAAGVAFGQEDVEFGNFTDSASETALLLGAGVRFIADFGLYADLRQDFIFYEYSDLSQTSISVGYKF